ncbi:hypothetical protein KAR28_05295 [Candidatus Parcubacteria bacterium]|nr:hypothetical protein [Candidatus Parcubacteria bacterium]
MPYTILKKFKLSKKLIVSSDKLEKNRELVLSLPQIGGIYIVSTDKELERLWGKSDILYIGQSGNLRRRMKYLLKYFLPSDFVGNWGRHTARNALKVILDETDTKVYISYVTCSNYKKIETRLLQKYCKNHIESPPLNNQRK